jgi:uncharacterized membrane protein YhaH (DUF805 family)
VFSIIAWVVAFIAAFAVLGLNVTDGKLPTLDEPGKLVQMILDYLIVFIILFGAMIAIWISCLAVGVKRLHDRNKSGWWIILFFVVPWLSGPVASVADKNGSDTAGLIVALVGLVFLIWGFIVLAILRGTRGPNRFGPDPLQLQGEGAAAPAARA